MFRVGEFQEVTEREVEAWLPFVGKYRKLKGRTDVGIALSPEQERALLQAASALDSACHTATVLCLDTAMRSDEIRRLRWSQIDLVKRTLVVGHSKSEAGTGRAIPLNVTAWKVLVRWAGRYPGALPEHHVFPGCESERIDPTRRGAGDQLGALLSNGLGSIAASTTYGIPASPN